MNRATTEYLLNILPLDRGGRMGVFSSPGKLTVYLLPYEATQREWHKNEHIPEILRLRYASLRMTKWGRVAQDDE